MIAFSPGLVQGCFDLLNIVSRQPLSFPQIRSSFAHFGSLPSTKIVEAAQRIKWLRANDDGVAEVTPSGAWILSLLGYETMLRQALLDYIDTERPPWIQNSSFGRSRVLSFAGNEVAQVFVEAGLAHGTDDEVVAFWDTLASRARGQKNDRLTAIGRQGERLTLAYEERRTGRKPKWIAIDNNSDGYDVLSIVEAEDARQLSIEVKASTMGIAGSFYITRNEWERATEGDSHRFHLWNVKSMNEPLLAVISQGAMLTHIPIDGGDGEWISVEIPFSAFQDFFAPIPLPMRSEARAA